jgi:hypothetical protein
MERWRWIPGSGEIIDLFGFWLGGAWESGKSGKSGRSIYWSLGSWRPRVLVEVVVEV